jgi:hypothetical protein
MTWSVLVTGSHWLLDAVAGVVVVAVAYLATRAVTTVARGRAVSAPMARQPIGSEATRMSA